MILKFCAKGDLLVTVPGTTTFAGQVARYVNRRWDEAKGGFPAQTEPFAVDSDSKDGRRLAKICRRDGDLLPYDKETADFLGLKFAPLKLTDGVWELAPVNAKKGDSQ